ncbi:alpha-1,6-mannosyl-glycoprotein 2-beta-N-acetylglucosaminyltransferase isoform X4 [Aphidius gifuensis]|uniref:alpha-1,6-mannosyl-glycoprotein 2-beta-N-acetylglucosaminyltransferase isoform X4 n=1 Tax=Aphidius gifuensis TaxID=684658 RepID=UPI001CDD5013|nr:alpha-1,6-mannosyl-glycoprotein 2-beta-N-acetylglucosaminyltransferase isoform X4 [Aphidius gifuensis]
MIMNDFNEKHLSEIPIKDVNMRGKPSESDVERGLVKPYSVSSVYTRKKSGYTRAGSSVGGGRSTRGTILRTFAFVFLATFLWLQIHVSNLTTRNQPSQSANETLFSLVPPELHRFFKERHNVTIQQSLNGTNLTNPEVEIFDIKKIIKRINDDQNISNDDAFGPLETDSTVILIQVHTRILYLRHLIVSLAQAKGIEKILLIFSHDYWHPEINELIQKIEFCRVMQIFYPNSIQTHPNIFPGVDPNDCPRNIDKKQALAMNCTNARHPDLYGHYREAKFTQTKHHWWWKANYVFDQLHIMKNHTGLVLFLEEDHYVAEDFLHVLRLMEDKSYSECRSCNILSLGTYVKTYNYYTDYTRKAEVIPWISSKHNMGMAFNRTTWNKLRNCGVKFCSYDDYNWDWSLQHIAQSCLPMSKGPGKTPRVESGLVAMMMKAPRVFHIGECGVHHKKNNCDSTAVIAKVQNVLRSAKSHMFPTILNLTVANVKNPKLRKGNGGWGDKRDHELCKSMMYYYQNSK